MHGHIVPDALKQRPSTLTKDIGAPPGGTLSNVIMRRALPSPRPPHPGTRRPKVR
jgi:hypothetical protein